MGRYVIEGELGIGGMAIVYRAHHITLGTAHALKMLTMLSRSVIQRATREARIQARLRHPNVVPVTDVLEHQGRPVLVMELVDGPSLEQLLRRGPLDLPVVHHLMQGILEGVAAAHALGVVHRDLKPANVLIEVDGDRLVPRVTDFGLVTRVDGEEGGHHTRTGATMGTPAYMAPEQIRDAGTVDARADVYSLGAIIYELLAGSPPYPREADLVQLHDLASREQATDLSSLRPELPPALCAVVHRALSGEANRRWADAAALGAAWEATAELAPTDPSHVARAARWARELAPVASERSPRPAPSPDRSNGPSLPGAMGAGILVASLAVLLLGGGLGLAIWLGSPQGDAAPAPAPDPAVTRDTARADAPPALDPAASPAPPASAPEREPTAPGPDAAPVDSPTTEMESPASRSGSPEERGDSTIAGAEDRTGSEAPAAERPMAPATAAHIEVVGVDRASLIRADGERLPTGAVPPGSYTVEVWFDATRPVEVLELDLLAGERRTLRCQRTLQLCR